MPDRCEVCGLDDVDGHFQIAHADDGDHALRTPNNMTKLIEFTTTVETSSSPTTSWTHCWG